MTQRCAIHVHHWALITLCVLFYDTEWMVCVPFDLSVGTHGSDRQAFGVDNERVD